MCTPKYKSPNWEEANDTVQTKKEDVTKIENPPPISRTPVAPSMICVQGRVVRGGGSELYSIGTFECIALSQIVSVGHYGLHPNILRRGESPYYIETTNGSKYNLSEVKAREVFSSFGFEFSNQKE